jgi:hypothetical protein
VKKMQRRVVTTLSPDEVYQYLVDFRNQAEWRFDVLSSELVSGEPGRVGAKYRQRVRSGRRERLREVELTEASRPDKVSFRTVEGGPVSVSGAWHIRPDGRGTEILCDVAIAAHGPLRLLEPAMGPSLRRIAARYQRALRRHLDGL